jgi:light-harvesting complex I chlorophyll a/b binding protein 1
MTATTAPTTQLTTALEIFGAALVTALAGRWFVRNRAVLHVTGKAAPAPQPRRLTRSVQPRVRVVMMADAPTKTKEEEKTEDKKDDEPAEPAVIYSEALPFLTRRASLGPVGQYVGDVGFDPLGFTEIFSIEWLREAEIKHGRVSMLAFVGFVFTDFYHLPGFDYTTLEAHDACVASGAMSQLVLWLGALEVVSFIGIDQMLRGSGREPGDFGFDPLGFGSDPEKLADLRMKELANGRLAMFAFGGVVTQAVLTGNTFPYLFDNAPPVL